MRLATAAVPLFALVTLAAERPQDDLFASVNGAWLASTAMPPDRVTWGTFAELSDRTEAELGAIVEDVIAGRVRMPGAARQQITDLYRSAVDEARIEQRAAAPIAPELARIDAIGSPQALAAEAGYLSSIGVGGPFDGRVGRDTAHGGVPVVRVLPGGTLLPDLGYYVDDTADMVRARARYIEYLRRIFELTAREHPREAARDVLALETSIAGAQWSDTTQEPAEGRVTLRELATAMPGFDWTAWARPQGLDRVPALLLARPAFFRAFAALVPQVPLPVWRNWLLARYVTAAAPFLSSPFDQARFDFFGAALTGQQAPRVRWRRGVTMVGAYLGDALGRLYVERHFPSARRDHARRLVATVLDAARVAVHESRDLPPASKREALATLSTMSTGIGYPDDWHSYAGLVVKPDDLFGNWLRALAFEGAQRTPNAAAESRTWAQPPQTVNAYYAAAANQIVVPAALLQPPIFDPDGDEAANYGAAGALVGHEIAHALGATEEAADAAGLALAFRAYRLAVKAKPDAIVGGETGPRRFFVAWARMWRSMDRPEYARSTAAGAYVPGRERANRAASSVEAFYDAFGVRPGDRMYRPPNQRVGLR